jgi:hypothetical protein
MFCLEDLSKEDLRINATFEALAAAAAAAGHPRAATEQYRDVADTLQGAAPNLHQTTQEPLCKLERAQHG